MASLSAVSAVTGSRLAVPLTPSVPNSLRIIARFSHRPTTPNIRTSRPCQSPSRRSSVSETYINIPSEGLNGVEKANFRRLCKLMQLFPRLHCLRSLRYIVNAQDLHATIQRDQRRRERSTDPFGGRPGFQRADPSFARSSEYNRNT